jgi:hypothetical protein
MVCFAPCACRLSDPEDDVRAEAAQALCVFNLIHDTHTLELVARALCDTDAKVRVASWKIVGENDPVREHVVNSLVGGLHLQSVPVQVCMLSHLIVFFLRKVQRVWSTFSCACAYIHMYLQMCVDVMYIHMHTHTNTHKVSLCLSDTYAYMCIDT